MQYGRPVVPITAEPMFSVTPSQPQPVESSPPPRLGRDLLILAGLWLLAVLVDRTWVFLDHAPPHWDQGDHLTRALDHWRVLQQPSWLSADWWHTLWQQAPTQRAPLVYILTAPYFALFGPSFDAAVTVNLFLAAVLMVSTYLMGRRLFDRAVGLWAAGFVLLSPTLGRQRLDYLLDYGLTAMTAFTAMGLTYWWTATSRRGQWGFTLLWGIGVGLMLLTRTSALLFIVAMVGWLGLLCLLGRRWQRLLQLMVGVGLGMALIWPWFSTSWLTIISTTIESTAHGVSLVGSPQANTLAGWLYYPQRLPGMVTSPILWLGLAAGLLAIIGTLLPGLGWRSHPLHHPLTPARQAWLWLGGIIITILVLGALGANKNPRLLAPIIPFLCLALARMLWWRRDRTWQALRWLVALGASLVFLWAMFPLPGHHLGQRDRWWPYRGEPWPHGDIIAAMVEAAPHLQSTLGVIPSTPEIHSFSLGFYGGAADFQVYARDLALWAENIQPDAQALDWYLTKTGSDQGTPRNQADRDQLNAVIVSAPELELWQTWPLPDGGAAQLHHRRQPRVEVAPIPSTVEQVTLSAVEVPAQITAGQVAPITYRLEGPWGDLSQGLLLLSWQPNGAVGPPRWISDHGIGLGQLYGQGDPAASFAVIERLGVIPPADLPPGPYRLQATYVDRATQRSYTVAVPPTRVEILPGNPATAATHPPLDLVTVLRQLSGGLASGDIDPIFAEVGRINQYDPRQDYLVQAEQALGFRLQQYPDHLDWLYGKALAQVLQQQAPAAIASLNQITAVAPDNPYHWTYLGFVHLYSWQPRRAQAALDQAAALNPDLPDLKLLQAAAALMQLQIPKTISLLQTEGVL
jgi:4-amino-4-deoxy-L-arabinose transferase-like glycosyltransferase